MTEKLPTIEFDTRSLPPEARFPAWQAAVPDYETARPLGAADNFDAKVTAWLLGEIVITRSVMPAVNLARTAQRIATDNKDACVFGLVTKGTWTAQIGGDEVTAGAGQLLGIDQSQPYSISASAVDTTSVIVPRRVLEEAVRTEPDLHGRLFNDPPGLLLAEHIVALTKHLPNAAHSDIVPLRQALLAMIAAALSAAPSADGDAQNLQRVSHRAKRYVERHLSDPKLTPAALAEALHVPRSRLYEAFKPLGGIARYIQRRRLEAVRTLLMHPDENRPISELAHSFGFTNISHFATAFRRAFGQAPSAIKASKQWPGEPEAAKTAPDTPGRYRKWK